MAYTAVLDSPSGNSTSRFFRTFKVFNDSKSPICIGKCVISLQLTS